MQIILATLLLYANVAHTDLFMFVLDVASGGGGGVSLSNLDDDPPL